MAPLRGTDTESCARALIFHWIARFGMPLDLHQTGELNSHQHHGWVDELPWVLLGIHTAPKEDLKWSSAEFVFGSPITVPGDFIATPQGVQTSANKLSQLRDTVNKFRPIPPGMANPGLQCLLTFKTVATYVYVCRDSKHPSLQYPYEGPFLILERDSKFFTIDKSGRPDNVFIDRLKPAHLDTDQPVHVAKPRRRGRPKKQANTKRFWGGPVEAPTTDLSPLQF